MSEVRNILVPIDFSEDSEAALRVAVNFAKAFGAHLTLLHCYQKTLPDFSAYEIDAPEDFYHSIKKAAGEKLDGVRDRLRGEDLTISAEVRSSIPSEAICETAEELHADLIVMGTRGLSALKHVFVGSVAERTVRSAPCPVVTVRASQPS